MERQNDTRATVDKQKKKKKLNSGLRNRPTHMWSVIPDKVAYQHDGEKWSF